MTQKTNKTNRVATLDDILKPTTKGQRAEARIS